MAEKAGFKHFMQKEIFEQPQCIIDTFRGRISPETGQVTLPEFGLEAEELRNISRVVIVACGTSWHAGLVASFLSRNTAASRWRWTTVPNTAIGTDRRCPDLDHPDLSIRRDGRIPWPLCGKAGQGGPGLGHLQRGGHTLARKRTGLFIPMPDRRSGWPPPRPLLPSWSP